MGARNLFILISGVTSNASPFCINTLISFLQIALTFLLFLSPFKINKFFTVSFALTSFTEVKLLKPYSNNFLQSLSLEVSAFFVFSECNTTAIKFLSFFWALAIIQYLATSV